MIFTAQELQRATGGELRREGPAGPIVTDTRRLQEGAWFLALRGESFDGHDFLPHARLAGCAGVVSETVPEGWDRGWVKVPDTLRALQDCASQVRSELQLPVVGITGSAGKTTTRAMVADVLGFLGRVHQTAGNLNNHIGLPLTLLSTPPDADVLVLEMGMSGPGEIRRLQEIGRPTHRLITNVSAAHLSGTGGIEGVAACKQELFDGAQPGDTVFVNQDDPRVRAMPLPEGVRVVRYGSSTDCDVRLLVSRVDTERLVTVAQIATPSEVFTASIPSPGRHLALDAAAAAAVGWSLRVPGEAIAEGLGRYQPVGMRMRVERRGGLTVLNDAYNANPASLRAALETLAGIGQRRRVALLGSMLELGDAEEEAHREAVLLASELGIEVLGLCGRMADFAHLATGAEVISAPDSEALAQALKGRLADGDVVLIKGSRGARMERVLAEGC